MTTATADEGAWHSQARYQELVTKSSAWVLAARNLDPISTGHFLTDSVLRHTQALLWHDASVAEYRLWQLLKDDAKPISAFQSLTYGVQYALFAGQVHNARNWLAEATTDSPGPTIPMRTRRDFLDVRHQAAVMHRDWTKLEKFVRAHFRGGNGLDTFPMERAVDAARRFPAVGLGGFLLARVLQEQGKVDEALLILRLP